MSDERAIAESLCAKALAGAIDLDGFYREWPSKPAVPSFWATVYEDLEEGIQHTPGNWFGGKVDAREWERCWEYFVIYVDLLVIRSNKDDPLLRAAVRDKALSGKKMSLTEAEAFVARELARS